MQASSFSASFLRKSDVKLKQFELGDILDKCFKFHSTQPWPQRWKEGPERSPLKKKIKKIPIWHVKRAEDHSGAVLSRSRCWSSTPPCIADRRCLVNIPRKHASGIRSDFRPSGGIFPDSYYFICSLVTVLTSIQWMSLPVQTPLNGAHPSPQNM